MTSCAAFGPRSLQHVERAGVEYWLDRRPGIDALECRLIARWHAADGSKRRHLVALWDSAGVESDNERANAEIGIVHPGVVSGSVRGLEVMPRDRLLLRRRGAICAASLFGPLDRVAVDGEEWSSTDLAPAEVIRAAGEEPLIVTDEVERSWRFALDATDHRCTEVRLGEDARLVLTRCWRRSHWSSQRPDDHLEDALRGPRPWPATGMPFLGLPLSARGHFAIVLRDLAVPRSGSGVVADLIHYVESEMTRLTVHPDRVRPAAPVAA